MTVSEHMENERRKLRNLVERLRREDHTFGYSYKVDYDRPAEKIVTKLRVAYERNEFVFDDPRMVKDYIRRGDIVEYAANYDENAFYLEKGAEGVIINLDISHRLLIEFPPKIRAFISKEDFIVYGQKGGLLRKEKTYPETRGNCLRLKKYDRIRYTPWVDSGQVVNGLYRVKKGTRALVVDHFWRDVQVKFPGVPSIDRTTSTPYRMIKLVRKNNVDFEKIYREVFEQ